MSGWAALRGIQGAVVFLTRIPAGGRQLDASDWRWANAHFPLIGAVVGCFSALVWTAARPFGPWLGAVFAVAATVALTGAFHEDGLADTADALGGGIESRERVLEILKDSRLGTYGVVTLVFALLLRIGIVARLDEAAPVALVLAHCLARLPPVALALALPYVTRTSESRSRDLLRAGPPQLVVALAWTVVACVVLPVGMATIAAIVIALALMSVILGLHFRARVGGITGDFLGATEQVGEIVVLTVCAWP